MTERIIKIIGGGLAGCAVARALRRRGFAPVIYEAGSSLAPGASGNELGMVNPRFSAEYGPEGEFYWQGYKLALSMFDEMEGIDWNPCGALHLITDEKKERRFPKTLQNWPACEDEMRILNAQEASDVAGVELSHAALYLPGGGSVSPAKLCGALADGCEIRLGEAVREEVKSDIVIYACGMGTAEFFSDLPLKPVRGQVTKTGATPQSRNLRCNVHYGGYLSAAQADESAGGWHMLGASFQPWLDHDDILPQDNADNLAKLSEVAAELMQEMEVLGARAAVRTTVPDHFPVAGRLDEGRYVSTAHGSHGVISSLLAAEIIAAEIAGEESPVRRDVLDRLSADRFLV